MKSLPDFIREVQARVGVTVDGIAGPKTWAAILGNVSPSRSALRAGGQRPTEEVEHEHEQEQEKDGIDARSAGNIATLSPDAQRAARIFLVAVNNTLRSRFSSDVVVKIICGMRDYPTQDSLYAQGRTVPGSIVTNARGGYSNHNFGIAFDIGVFDPNGRYLPEHSAYDVAGEVGKSLGLAWGGDWKSPVDKPHFELHPAWARTMSEHDMLAEFRRRQLHGEAIA